MKKTNRSNNAASIWTVFIVLALMLAFAGCETLDFANPNSPEISSATMQTLVTGAEGFMRADLDVYLQVVITIGREGYFFEGADPRFTGELLNGPIDPGGFLTTRPWSARYQVIFNCNELLNRAASMDAADAAGVEAYAKTVRAYQLLLNLNYLDDQGIRLNYDGDLTVPFATKAEAFDAIEQDLNEAMTALGNAGDAFPFALSSGFAGFDTPATFGRFNRALAARVAVYRGDFSGALTALGQSFLDAGGDLNAGVQHSYSTAANDELNPVFEVRTTPALKLHAHMSFEADAEAGDLRFANKTFKRGVEDVLDDLRSDLAITTTSSSTDPFPIIRNEELILLRAEANVGLGNYGEAETDMNIVRAAAGLAALAGTDATNGLDRLLHEKRYSLFAEGHRWIDMRRYGKLSELPIDRPGRDRVIEHMAIPETERSESN